MAYTTIDDPSAFFQCTLYTGNGGTQSITNTGNSDLQPDMVWVKARNLANEKTRVVDVVRGVGVALKMTDVGGNSSEGTGLTAFNSDGFSLGAQAAYNNNTNTFVSWQWKAGTSFTNSAGANGANLATTAGSVNTDAGFSIIKWNGSGMAGEGLLAHGLGVVPSVIIIKTISANNDDWYVYHKDIGATKYVRLNQAAAETSASFLENKTPTSTLISLDNGFWGTSSIDYISYCFAEKKGYSKFGSYIGNANADGPMIFTGFKPALFIFKDTESTTSWIIKDNKRLGFNGIVPHLQLNTNDTENTDGWSEVDFLSNGIKLRNADNSMNKSGSKFIYMAFAEQPFVTSTGVPTTAR